MRFLFVRNVIKLSYYITCAIAFCGLGVMILCKSAYMTIPFLSEKSLLRHSSSVYLSHSALEPFFPGLVEFSVN